MIRHGLLEHELLCYFTAALGCRSQTFDATGLNASPDPEAGITDALFGRSGEVTRHRRVRALLAKIPSAYSILAEAYAPRRPLPPQVVHQLGGREPVARLFPRSWSLVQAFEEQGGDFATFIAAVARGGKHQALRDRALEEADLMLASALDMYASVRRSSREAA